MPSSTPLQKAVFRGSRWPGINGIQNVFIFGDSYSSIDEEEDFLPNPTSSQPLGTAFPGEPWTDDGKPNWVGHLVSNLAPHLRIYDYAKGGETVKGLSEQVKDKFLGLQSKTVRWTPTNSLFVLWIGINDLGETASPIEPIRVLFDLMSELYESGARNFLLIDCPPIHRTPAELQRAADTDFGPSADRYEEWNKLLGLQARSFVARYQEGSLIPEAGIYPIISSPASWGHSRSSSRSQSNPQSNQTSPRTTPLGPSPLLTPGGTGVQGDLSVFVFSSWDTFSSILDYPEAYEFDEDDVDEPQGQIWMDSLHPTSKVHSILAKHLHKFLSCIN